MSEDNGWRPIETAPRDGREIMVYDDDIPEFAHWEPSTAYTAGGSWRARNGVHVFLPQYWQPLPKPPVADQGEGG